MARIFRKWIMAPETEIFVYGMAGITITAMEQSVLNANEYLKEVQNTPLPAGYFGPLAEQCVKTILSLAVLARSYTIYPYLFSYFAVLAVAFFGQGRHMLLPWLTLSVLRHFVVDVGVALTGLFICLKYHITPVCGEFIVMRLLRIGTAAYMWHSVRKYHHELGNDTARARRASTRSYAVSKEATRLLNRALIRLHMRPTSDDEDDALPGVSGSVGGGVSKGAIKGTSSGGCGGGRDRRGSGGHTRPGGTGGGGGGGMGGGGGVDDGAGRFLRRNISESRTSASTAGVRVNWMSESEEEAGKLPVTRSLESLLSMLDYNAEALAPLVARRREERRAGEGATPRQRALFFLRLSERDVVAARRRGGMCVIGSYTPVRISSGKWLHSGSSSDVLEDQSSPRRSSAAREWRSRRTPPPERRTPCSASSRTTGVGCTEEDAEYSHGEPRRISSRSRKSSTSSQTKRSGSLSPSYQRGREDVPKDSEDSSVGDDLSELLNATSPRSASPLRERTPKSCSSNDDHATQTASDSEESHFELESEETSEKMYISESIKSELEEGELRRIYSNNVIEIPMKEQREEMTKLDARHQVQHEHLRAGASKEDDQEKHKDTSNQDDNRHGDESKMICQNKQIDALQSDGNRYGESSKEERQKKQIDTPQSTANWNGENSKDGCQKKQTDAQQLDDNRCGENSKEGRQEKQIDTPHPVDNLCGENSKERRQEKQIDTSQSVDNLCRENSKEGRQKNQIDTPLSGENQHGEKNEEKGQKRPINKSQADDNRRREKSEERSQKRPIDTPHSDGNPHRDRSREMGENKPIGIPQQDDSRYREKSKERDKKKPTYTPQSDDNRHRQKSKERGQKIPIDTSQQDNSRHRRKSKEKGQKKPIDKPQRVENRYTQSSMERSLKSTTDILHQYDNQSSEKSKERTPKNVNDISRAVLQNKVGHPQDMVRKFWKSPMARSATNEDASTPPRSLATSTQKGSRPVHSPTTRSISDRSKASLPSSKISESSRASAGLETSTKTRSQQKVKTEAHVGKDAHDKFPLSSTTQTLIKESTRSNVSNVNANVPTRAPITIRAKSTTSDKEVAGIKTVAASVVSTPTSSTTTSPTKRPLSTKHYIPHKNVHTTSTSADSSPTGARQKTISTETPITAATKISTGAAKVHRSQALTKKQVAPKGPINVARTTTTKPAESATSAIASTGAPATAYRKGESNTPVIEQKRKYVRKVVVSSPRDASALSAGKTSISLSSADETSEGDIVSAVRINTVTFVNLTPTETGNSDFKPTKRNVISVSVDSDITATPPKKIHEEISLKDSELSESKECDLLSTLTPSDANLQKTHIDTSDESSSYSGAKQSSLKEESKPQNATQSSEQPMPENEDLTRSAPSVTSRHDELGDSGFLDAKILIYSSESIAKSDDTYDPPTMNKCSRDTANTICDTKEKESRSSENQKKETHGDSKAIQKKLRFGDSETVIKLEIVCPSKESFGGESSSVDDTLSESESTKEETADGGRKSLCTFVANSFAQGQLDYVGESENFAASDTVENDTSNISDFRTSAEKIFDAAVTDSLRDSVDIADIDESHTENKAPDSVELALTCEFATSIDLNVAPFKSRDDISTLDKPVAIEQSDLLTVSNVADVGDVTACNEFTASTDLSTSNQSRKQKDDAARGDAAFTNLEKYEAATEIVSEHIALSESSRLDISSIVEISANIDVGGRDHDSAATAVAEELATSLESAASHEVTDKSCALDTKVANILEPPASNVPDVPDVKDTEKIFKSGNAEETNKCTETDIFQHAITQKGNVICGETGSYIVSSVIGENITTHELDVKTGDFSEIRPQGIFEANTKYIPDFEAGDVREGVETLDYQNVPEAKATIFEETGKGLISLAQAYAEADQSSGSIASSILQSIFEEAVSPGEALVIQNIDYAKITSQSTTEVCADNFPAIQVEILNFKDAQKEFKKLDPETDSVAPLKTPLSHSTAASEKSTNEGDTAMTADKIARLDRTIQSTQTDVKQRPTVHEKSRVEDMYEYSEALPPTETCDTGIFVGQQTIGGVTKPEAPKNTPIPGNVTANKVDESGEKSPQDDIRPYVKTPPALEIKYVDDSVNVDHVAERQGKLKVRDEPAVLTDSIEISGGVDDTKKSFSKITTSNSSSTSVESAGTDVISDADRTETDTTDTESSPDEISVSDNAQFLEERTDTERVHETVAIVSSCGSSLSMEENVSMIQTRYSTDNSSGGDKSYMGISSPEVTNFINVSEVTKEDGNLPTMVTKTGFATSSEQLHAVADEVNNVVGESENNVERVELQEKSTFSKHEYLHQATKECFSVTVEPGPDRGVKETDIVGKCEAVGEVTSQLRDFDEEPLSEVHVSSSVYSLLGDTVITGNSVLVNESLESFVTIPQKRCRGSLSDDSNNEMSVANTSPVVEVSNSVTDEKSFSKLDSILQAYDDDQCQLNKLNISSSVYSILGEIVTETGKVSLAQSDDYANIIVKERTKSSSDTTIASASVGVSAKAEENITELETLFSHTIALESPSVDSTTEVIAHLDSLDSDNSGESDYDDSSTECDAEKVSSSKKSSYENTMSPLYVNTTPREESTDKSCIFSKTGVSNRVIEGAALHTSVISEKTFVENLTTENRTSVARNIPFEVLSVEVKPSISATVTTADETISPLPAVSKVSSVSTSSSDSGDVPCCDSSTCPYKPSFSACAECDKKTKKCDTAELVSTVKTSISSKQVPNNETKKCDQHERTVKEVDGGESGTLPKLNNYRKIPTYGAGISVKPSPRSSEQALAAPESFKSGMMSGKSISAVSRISDTINVFLETSSERDFAKGSSTLPEKMVSSQNINDIKISPTEPISRNTGSIASYFSEDIPLEEEGLNFSEVAGYVVGNNLVVVSEIVPPDIPNSPADFSDTEAEEPPRATITNAAVALAVASSLSETVAAIFTPRPPGTSGAESNNLTSNVINSTDNENETNEIRVTYEASEDNTDNESNDENSNKINSCPKTCPYAPRHRKGSQHNLPGTEPNAHAETSVNQQADQQIRILNPPMVRSKYFGSGENVSSDTTNPTFRQTTHDDTSPQRDKEASSVEKYTSSPEIPSSEVLQSEVIQVPESLPVAEELPDAESSNAPASLSSSSLSK